VWQRELELLLVLGQLVFFQPLVVELVLGLVQPLE
jgi:hypothetical protein